MASYRLTPDAENDLLRIAEYTVETWGVKQARRYEAALVRCFAALGQGSARTSTPLTHRPELKSCRCQHHYVFSLHEEGDRPTIIAVLHEKMDLITRLRERLGDDSDSAQLSD